MGAREGLGKGLPVTDQPMPSRKQVFSLQGLGAGDTFPNENVLCHILSGFDFRIKLPAGLLPIEFREEALPQAPASQPLSPQPLHNPALDLEVCIFTQSSTWICLCSNLPFRQDINHIGLEPTIMVHLNCHPQGRPLTKASRGGTHL